MTHRKTIRPSSWRTPTGDARSRWPDYTASVWQHRATSALPLTPPTRAEAREPRNVDKPANRVEDIHRACDILAQYPGVDASRVGVLGICGGGGYTLKAAGRALRTCVKPILICSPSFPVILSAGLPFPPAVSQMQDGFLQKTGRKPTACKGKFVSLQAVCRHTPQASGAQTPHIKHI